MTKVHHQHRPKTKLQSILYALEDTRQWIIQADTKGGFLLTVYGVIFGFMLQQMVPWFSAFNKTKHPLWVLIAMVVVFAAYLAIQGYSLWHTVQVIVPRTPASRPDQTALTRHVFNYSLALHFPAPQDTARLFQEYHDLSLTQLENEFVARLHVDSLVCTAKYHSFERAFRGLPWTLLLTLLGVIGIQSFHAVP